nr:Plasmid replication region DNA-binding N-term [Pseudomonas sp.]
MARSAEFTEDKIIEAGRSMLAAGKRITGFGLRNAVGGGNANRLLEVWETHALQHSESEPELLSELPLEVSEHLGNVINSFTGEFKEQMTRLAVDMNHRAHKASERRVKEMTRAAEEMQEAAKAEVEDASAAVEKAEGELEKSRNLAADFERRLNQSQEADRQKGFEITQLKKELADLQKSASKAADEAVKEITKLNNQVEKLEGEKDSAVSRVSRLEGELESAAKRHSEDKAENSTLHKQLAVKDQEIGKLSGKLEAAETSHNELKAFHEVVQKARRKIEEELKAAESNLTNEKTLHQDEIAKSKTEIEKRDAEIAELKKKLTPTTKDQ